MSEWIQQPNGAQQWRTATGVWAKERCGALTAHGLDESRGEACWWVPDAVVTRDNLRDVNRWRLWVRGWATQLDNTYAHPEEAKAAFVTAVAKGWVKLGGPP